VTHSRLIKTLPVATLVTANTSHSPFTNQTVTHFRLHSLDQPTSSSSSPSSFPLLQITLFLISLSLSLFKLKVCLWADPGIVTKVNSCSTISKRSKSKREELVTAIFTARFAHQITYIRQECVCFGVVLGLFASLFAWRDGDTYESLPVRHFWWFFVLKLCRAFAFGDPINVRSLSISLTLFVLFRSRHTCRPRRALPLISDDRVCLTVRAHIRHDSLPVLVGLCRPSTVRPDFACRFASFASFASCYTPSSSTSPLIYAPASSSVKSMSSFSIGATVSLSLTSAFC
jgi:hypothetical protein